MAPSMRLPMPLDRTTPPIPRLDPSGLLDRRPKPRLTHTLLPLARESPLDERKVIIQHLRIPQTRSAPVLVNPRFINGVGVRHLRVQELELSALQRWIALVALVEGVVGEGLDVEEVLFLTHGLHGLEGGYDGVAGVDDDPVSIVLGLR